MTAPSKRALATAIAAARSQLRLRVLEDKRLNDALRGCVRNGRIVRALPTGCWLP